MARLSLFHESAAKRGDAVSFNGKPAAAEYLRELAWRIRQEESTPDERELAAQILEKLATSRKGWAAAGLVVAHRPPSGGRDWKIAREVAELVDAGAPVGEARARVAQRVGLSVSRVKAICLEDAHARRLHDLLTSRERWSGTTRDEGD